MIDHRARTVGFVSLGCAKNLVDAEVMLGVLAGKGFVVVGDLAEAKVIVVNTCGFLQRAVEEGIDRILEVAKYKQDGCCQRLVVAGCMVERYREKLRRELPEVDAFISTDELQLVDQIVGMTEECRDERRVPSYLYDHRTPRLVSSLSGSAYVKIADGCNRPCSFCIIPKIRGRYRSRQPESVVAEVVQLLEAGRREINLIAQDVTFFGRDFRDPAQGLIPLLRAIVKQTAGEDYWLRLLYAFPDGVSQELVELIKNERVICDYLDLPLQHISAELLKRMKRPCGEAKTRQLIAKIKEWHPGITLRTSFIVGFPGESEADVERLADFVRETEFDHVGIFTYSPEEEASSSEYPDDVPQAEKEARLDYLMSIQQGIVNKRQQKLLGKTEKVLIEGFHPESELLLIGRSSRLAPEVDGQIIINDIDPDCLPPAGLPALFGRFAPVTYTTPCAYDLLAKLVSDVK